MPTLKAVVAGLLAALPGMGSIVLLIRLIYYVFAVIAVKLYGPEFPELFGTLGKSFFTLFTVMTLEGWVDGVVKPMMEKFPRAWIFFVTFIVMTTFMVLNLFIGVVVNAMQKEHAKAEQPSSRPSARSSRRKRRRSSARSAASRPTSRSCARRWREDASDRSMIP